MSWLKAVARDWIPPVVTDWIRRVRADGIRFEGEYATWEEACLHCSGYDAQDILEKVLAATVKVKHGDAIFERDSVLFYEVEYVWPVLSGLMWAAARNRGVLNVLDFGGALGSTYLQHKKILQTLPDVRWNVVEQPHFVQAGRAHVQDDVLHFYHSIDECLIDNKPNVILLSSVLQYIQNPFELLKMAMDADAQFIIIDRTPFSNSAKDRLCIQHVPLEIYESKLICWIFSLEQLTQILSSKFHLVADFVNDDQIGGTNFQLMGSIWQRRVFSSQQLDS